MFWSALALCAKANVKAVAHILIRAAIDKDALVGLDDLCIEEAPRADWPNPAGILAVEDGSEARRAELEKIAAEKLAAAQGVADKMAGLSVSVARKAGMDGRLFGSVGNADIADALKAAGFEVDKAAIRMPEGPLKAIGEFPLDVALHTDVLANITVAVVAE